MQIEFDLLANAIDSIDRAIELVAWKDEKNDAKRLKQAVLSIAHGVELLLKERLRRIHPVLIWENVDKYPSLSARTVTVDGALSRLSKIGGLNMSKEECALITSLRDTRNAIEHFAWLTTKAEADHIVGHALGFAVHFAKDELNYVFVGDYASRKDDTLTCLLESNPHFAEAFRSRYERSIASQGPIKLECKFCRARAVNPSTGSCDLCGHWSWPGSDKEIPF